MFYKVHHTSIYETVQFLTFHCGSAKELLENGTFKFSIRFKAPEINNT